MSTDTGNRCLSLNCGGTGLVGSYQFYHSLSGIRQFLQIAILECSEMQTDQLLTDLAPSTRNKHPKQTTYRKERSVLVHSLEVSVHG